jgi:hypothetical protein
LNTIAVKAAKYFGHSGTEIQAMMIEVLVRLKARLSRDERRLGPNLNVLAALGFGLLLELRSEAQQVLNVVDERIAMIGEWKRN